MFNILSQQIQYPYAIFQEQSFQLHSMLNVNQFNSDLTLNFRMSLFKKIRNIFYNVQAHASSYLTKPGQSKFRMKSIQDYQCKHDPRFPKVVRDEKCISCNTTQCYICSENQHISNSCKVQLSKLIYPSLPSYQNPNNIQKLKTFNFGQVGRVQLNNLKCICGKAWTSGFSICSACGMVSCSKKCHSVWEEKGNCNMHNLFRKQYNSKSDMRSILYQNIQYAINEGLEQGTQVNTNKSKFITCFLSDNPKEVYLQRGYRIYGHPNQSLVQQLNILPKNLDFYLHMDRICDCDCKDCKKMYHSVGMCTSPCQLPKLQKLKQGLNEKKHEQICECECAHCSSGKITKGHSHSVVDCMFQCKCPK